MPDIRLPTTVNQHFLKRVVELGTNMNISTLQDVVDARGSVLLARGTRLHAGLVDGLVQRSLGRPLEACLHVETPIDGIELAAVASSLLEACTPVGRFLRAAGCSAAVPLLTQVDISEPLALLLTLSCHSAPGALEHNVSVAMLSVAMARKLHLADDDLYSACLAGLLHDIGELHHAPEALKRDHIAAHDWARVAHHPILGQLLVNELDCLPLSVGRAIAEHHERFDGTGYPRHLAGHNISACGQAVAIADMLAGLLQHDHPFEQMELALRIAPSEFARDLVASAVQLARAQPRPAPRPSDSGPIERLYWRVSSAIEAGQNLHVNWAGRPCDTSDMLDRTLLRIRSVERAFANVQVPAVAAREIQWRLCDIARDLALRTSPDQRSVFAALITLLDGEAPVNSPSWSTPDARVA